MQITDQLRVVIEAEVERAIRDMDKWDKSVGETENKLDALEKAADKISGRLMLVSGGFTAVGAAGLKFAADVETQKIALEVLTGSAETAAKVFGDLQQFAAKTPLSMDDINAAATQLLNFGTGVDDVTATLKTLGDVSMGNAGKLDTVVRAYGRMQMKGKATMEELNMLTEAGVPILGQLASGMGVATDEIFKMAATGKVSFTDVQTALAALTGEGGKFNNMLERQSASLSGKLSTALDNLKISGAKLMETVVPMAKDLLDAISRAAEGFQTLDEGTKKAIISLMAIGAAAGPISKTGAAAIGLVKAVMGLTTMNPAVLGIVAITAAVAALAGAFLTAKMNAKSFEDGLKSFKASQEEALASSKTYEEMQRTVPALTRAMYDAAKATGNFDKAIADATKLQNLRDELSKLEKDVASKSESMQTYLGALKDKLKEPINTASKGWFDGPKDSIEKIKYVTEALNGLDGNMRKILRESADFKAAFDARNFEGMLKVVESINGASPETKKRIQDLKKAIEEIGSGTTITPKIAPPPVAEAKKTWKDWWQEIIGVDQETFRTGAEAATLYLDGLGSELAYAEAVGAALGEKINPVPYLEKQKEKINEDLIRLLSIQPGDILKGDEFNFGLEVDESGNAKIDASIRSLIDRYRELSGAIAEADVERKKLAKSEEFAKKAADMVKSIETPLERYQARLAEIDEIWEAQNHEGQMLTEAQLLKLTAQAADEYRAALAGVEREQEKARSASFEEWIQELSHAWWKNVGATDAAAAALARIGTQIALTTIDGLLDGFKELGQAWADGAVSAEELSAALGNVAKKVLDMLPTLFIQAGLQLLDDPSTRGLGLGLIFGGISTAIIAGLTEGATKNAKGNIFDSGAIVPFARGGAFTNGIVDRATRFNIGEMGEAGPEAIVPLTRMTDGSLGVQTTGGASPQEINFQVINYSGQRIQKRETSNGSIREIEMIVGSLNEKLISEGRYDRANAARYGQGRRAVRG